MSRIRAGFHFAEILMLRQHPRIAAITFVLKSL
jgi:hypothetical protein